MKIRVAMLAAWALPCVLFSAQPGFAACGVFEAQASGKTVNKATRKAERSISRQVRKLREQAGKKLQLGEKSVSCLGGGVAIDTQGNQITGDPSCTVTQPFCVNP